MAIQYKQKCSVCKKNYVLISGWRNRYPMCDECKKKELNQKIDDPEMKKLFDIPQEYYMKNNFLRNIKVNYHKYGNLSERQIETFKSTYEEIKKKELEKKEKKTEDKKKKK